MLFRTFTFSFILTLLANTVQCAAASSPHEPQAFFLNLSAVKSVNVGFGDLPTALPPAPYIPGNDSETMMSVFRPADIISAVKQAIDRHREEPTPAFEMALNFPTDAATLVQVRDLFRAAAYEDKLTGLHLVGITSPLPDDIFSGFTNLRSLTLGYMLLPTKALEHISPSTFAGLRALEVLSIHDIKLHTIHPEAFNDLASLRALMLTMCIPLDHMPMNPDLLPSLEYLDMGTTGYGFRFIQNQAHWDTTLLAIQPTERRSTRHDLPFFTLLCSKPTGATEGSVYRRFIQQLALFPRETDAVAAPASSSPTPEVTAEAPHAATETAEAPLHPEEPLPSLAAPPPATAEPEAEAPTGVDAAADANATPAPLASEEESTSDASADTTTTAHPTADAPAPLHQEASMPAPTPAPLASEEEATSDAAAEAHVAVAAAPLHQAEPLPSLAAAPPAAEPEAEAPTGVDAAADANATPAPLANAAPAPSDAPAEEHVAAHPMGGAVDAAVAVNAHPAQPHVPAVHVSCSPQGCLVQ